MLIFFTHFANHYFFLALQQTKQEALRNLLYVYWDMNPNVPLPDIGISVQWYGLMWSISIISCFYVGRWILRNEKLKEEHLVLIIQYIFLGAIIGARLGQVFFYQWDYFSQHPLEIFAVWNGGLSSHGGIIGGIVGIYLFIRSHRQYSLLWLLDSAALVMAMPCALIRLGNLFNSELYGKATDVPWAFVFERIDDVPRHAVVLYEAIAYGIIFFVILFSYRHFGRVKDGVYFSFFFVAMFAVRFVIEFWKEPDGVPIIPFISRTQFLSLPFIIVGVIAFVYFSKRNAVVDEV